MYEATRPSLVVRPVRFAAEAWPFTRRISIALSTSPLASARAALQSMMPAPVRSRSALTSAAEISAITGSLPGLGAGGLTALRRGGRRLLGLLAGALLGLLALALPLGAPAPPLPPGAAL